MKGWSRERRRGRRRLAYLLITPAVLLMALVTAYPIVYSVWLSLNRVSLTEPGRTGIRRPGQLRAVLSDGCWWSALG